MIDDEQIIYLQVCLYICVCAYVFDKGKEEDKRE